MPTLFAIDSMALLYRSHFAMIRTPLTNSKGLNTSGLYGFITQLIRIIEQMEPDYLAVVSDTSEPTFRHQEFPEYKATREKMPEELVEQLPYLPRLIEALNLPWVIKPGFEADDIIGTLMRLCREKEIHGVMVTGDKDYMQLVSDTTVMLDNKNQTIALKEVAEKFGGTPQQVVEVLALMGDSSDNVPGVRGIGEKTAKKLIEKYHSVENLYEHLDELRGKQLENLQNGRDNAFLSKRLVTIDCHVPIDENLEVFHLSNVDFYNNPTFHEILRELEFKSLVKKFAQYSASPSAPAAVEKTESFSVQSEPLVGLDSLKSFIQHAQQQVTVAVQVQLESGHMLDAQCSLFAFCTQDNQAVVLDLKHESLSGKREEVLACLAQLFAQEALVLAGHDLKGLLHALTNMKLEVQCRLFDTLVASHLLDGSEKDHSLKALAERRLNLPTGLLSDQQDQPDSLLERQPNSGLVLSAALVFKLMPHMTQNLSNTGMLENYHHIEMPLLKTLVRMEHEGVCFDRVADQKIHQEFNQRLEEMTAEIHALAEQSFNINSVVELQQVLYDKLALHKQCDIKPKKIKLGNGMSTDEETLEKMASHPLPRAILNYREINKLTNTYVETLPTFVHSRSGRIHSTFRQTVAATGRLASDKPNLQNIPIRSEAGKRIRHLFVPRDENHSLLAADYSQIELRVVAHYSKDPTFLKAYREQEDIHRLTAAAIYNVAPEEVTREMRSGAKEVNFGLIYRMGPERLALVTHTTKEEAKLFIEKYFAQYATIHALQERFLELARQNGFASTLLGRRRYLPDINGKGLAKRFAEGAAINTPIQGSAAEIIKLAMIAIDKRIKQEHLHSRMILSVHDELVFDVPQTELDLMRDLVKHEMENVMMLEVPLVAEVGTGPSWLEAH